MDPVTIVAVLQDVGYGAVVAIAVIGFVLMWYFGGVHEKRF